MTMTIDPTTSIRPQRMTLTVSPTVNMPKGMLRMKVK